MNLQQLIYSIIQSNSPRKRQTNIKLMSQKIIDQIEHLDELQSGKKLKEQRALLQSFFKIIQQISNQVQQTRKKYLNLDRDKLKEQKCFNMARDIHIFKQQCFYLKGKLAQAKEKLKDIRIQNQILQEQQKGLQGAYAKKKDQKNKLKYEFVMEATNFQKSRPYSSDNYTKQQKLTSTYNQKSKPGTQQNKQRSLLSYSQTFKNFKEQQDIVLSPIHAQKKSNQPTLFISTTSKIINKEIAHSMNVNPNSKTMGNFKINKNQLKVKKNQNRKSTKLDNRTAQFKRFISTSQQPRRNKALNINQALLKPKYPQFRLGTSDK